MSAAPRHRRDTGRFRVVTPSRTGPVAGERTAGTDIRSVSGTTSVAGGSSNAASEAAQARGRSDSARTGLPTTRVEGVRMEQVSWTQQPLPPAAGTALMVL